jgi:FlaA1/EpsC-like NDP-sugar epimerase
VIPSLETIDWHSFLARPAFNAPSPEMISSLIQQPVLVTGAGGSIGSALAVRLASHGAHIILLESSENNLHDLQREFADRVPSPHATFYLGSCADFSLLDEIFSLHHPQLVFHAAAYKHVPIIEEQPLAAVANNILATQTLVARASANQARVVLLSTDKAVNPASMMGATKRVAEQIVLAADGIVLRLGNVLASRGSVGEIFARQIAAGLQLTVTDPAARRYFLTIAEAVDLLLSAAAEAETPVLLAPQLSAPHFVADLARFMARTLSTNREPSIEFTHLRTGDKESEELWSADEMPLSASANGLVHLHLPLPELSQLQSKLTILRDAVQSRDLVAALDAIQILVPGYTASAAVLSQRSIVTSQVLNE